jgi:general stress protein 26
MTEQNQNRRSSDIRHLAELVKDIQFAMLTTEHFEDGSLRSRPVILQKTEFDGDFTW